MNPKHIAKAEDLVTPHEAVRTGFLEQAFAKTEKANPFIVETKQFYTALKQYKSIKDIASLQSIRSQLLAAAGFSSKAQTHLSDRELTDSLERVIKQIAGKYSRGWREEILYRYLLTMGDSLGGSIRNLTGALATGKFAKVITTALKAKGQTASIKRTPTTKVSEIKWQNRLLVFDKKAQFVNKGIDVILLDTTTSGKSISDSLKCQDDILLCGELKGGIDPAGADEHWKTASSALERIRKASNNPHLPLFFVGAAIANSMASEIYNDLNNGRLSHAANFTSPKQLADLASWLVSL